MLMLRDSRLPIASACLSLLSALLLQAQGTAGAPGNQPGAHSSEAAPFVKDFTKNVLQDQRAIWTSPFHMSKRTATVWILVGIGTAALIAADHPIYEAIPHSGASVSVGKDISYAGEAYTVYPIAAGLYGASWLTQDKSLRQTSFSSLEALADADIVVGAFKIVTRRQRPQDGDHGGHFEEGGASFPSAHSAQAWALASVIAHEYHDDKWVPWLVYAYATSVSAARVMALQHFTSDVFVGGAIGFFIGRYVVHVNSQRQNGTNSRHANLFPCVQPVFAGDYKAIQLAWTH